ncbi:GlxA family transcriptional regulator [Rodentibacter trehalosifermentans]|uniref:AraC family transcriptional regulator n=1 Tax=Rodentibacter trehalosifermentans TaxID=1908263 RepID=A0A1V3IVL8_9PAST|nr:helix-turn-helix domain-containing protein [Rodentibacter trehalosifermentans]OOF46124.1 AraC family transcriptional regulator [Rodentibacter trehalosifermentans]OOF52174.1 AraC family transcriptional regulator [Rodentibacter trehalosifermentans]
MSLPTVALVLYPNFNPFHFSVPYMIFTAEVENQALFQVNIVAESPQISQSAHTFIQADGDLSLLDAADFVVICGWDKPQDEPSEALKQALMQAYQRGATLVGLCYGAYPLAYTGLLNGKKATTHWLGEGDFKQRFPQVRLDCNSIYIEDSGVITSAGTAAGLDCCLAIVRKQYGVKIANQVARILVISPHREGGQAQFIEQPLTRKTPNENINELLEDIRARLAENHCIDHLAERLLMSRSTFTRHFRKATGMAFNQWLIEMRLQKGRELLESTKLTIEEISLQIGFHSTTAFRQHFKQKHHISPKQWQKRFA